MSKLSVYTDHSTQKGCKTFEWVKEIFGNKIIVLYANRQLLLSLTVDDVRQKVCDGVEKSSFAIQIQSIVVGSSVFCIQEC